MFLAAALGLGHADCERLGDGMFGQPVNTLSSLAFLLAGVWILLRARRAPGRRVELAVYGIAVALNSAGGVLFHGPQWPGSRWIHDTSILSVLLLILVFDIARRVGRPTRWTVTVFLISLVGLGTVFALLPSAAYVLYAVLGVGVGVEELLEYRHELPALRVGGLTARRAARIGALAALAIGATAFFVGRTGAPWCHPGSAFQWHAVWHVLSALVMALYAHGSIEPHPAERVRSA